MAKHKINKKLKFTQHKCNKILLKSPPQQIIFIKTVDKFVHCFIIASNFYVFSGFGKISTEGTKVYLHIMIML